MQLSRRLNKTKGKEKELKQVDAQARIRRKAGTQATVLPHLVHETTDRLLFGVRIQCTLSSLTTDLVRGQIEFPLPALNLVAKKFETVLDMHDLFFLIRCVC